MKTLLLLSIVLMLVSESRAQSSGTPIQAVNKARQTGKSNAPQEHLIPLKKLVGSEVSHDAKQEFVTVYGDIPAVWTRTTYYDQVSYTSGGERQTAYYDADSK